jgi:hypothetical protein
MISLASIIGYSGMLLAVISFTLNNMIWLRIINASGCLLLVIYGLMISAYPVSILNCVILIINIYKMSQASIKRPYQKSDTA